MMRACVILASLMAATAGAAAAQEAIPSWIKSTAGAWVDGTITDADFVSAMGYLVEQGVISVSEVEQQDSADAIPSWIKSTVGAWAGGIIGDAEFAAAIEFLMRAGIIAIPGNAGDAPGSGDPSSEDAGGAAPDAAMSSLDDELAACAEIEKARDRRECESAVEERIEVAWYKSSSEAYAVGPVTYYYPGLGTDGNDFVVRNGKPVLTVRILAENTSPERATLSCTGPAICNYDVWDGSRSFKYAGTDFTNGQIVLNAGDSRVFNMTFGPNIGYGGTQLEYDESRDYAFRIQEPWGSAEIPLDLR